MEQQTINLANQINSFEWGYEMSDDDSLWDKWNPIKEEINKQLLDLDLLDLCDVVHEFTHVGMRVFERYFFTNLIKKHDILRTTRLY